VTPVIGAIMRQEWFLPFEQSMRELGVTSTWLGDQLQGAHLHDFSPFEGVALELSDDVIGHESLGVPLRHLSLAGVPVSPDSAALASRLDISHVLWGESEAQSWLGVLDRSSLGFPGAVIVVWGPSGAPGSTSFAVGLALQAARSQPTLVIDADFVSPSMAQLLDLPVEGSGLLGALRAARLESPDPGALLVHAHKKENLGHVLQVLSGLDTQVLGPLEADSMGVLLQTVRATGRVVIVELKVPGGDSTTEPQSTVVKAVLGEADHLFLVARQSELGIARFVRQWAQIAPPMTTPTTLYLRQPLPAGVAAFHDAEQALWELCGVEDIRPLPAGGKPLGGPWFQEALSAVAAVRPVTPPVGVKQAGSLLSRLSSYLALPKYKPLA